MQLNKVNYCTLVKSGDSELRALSNTKFDKISTFPLIELTRGRRSKNDQMGRVEKRLDKLKAIYSNCNIGLDITTSSQLSNSEIDELYSFNGGYGNWLKFLKNLKNENVFKEIAPTILVDIEDVNLEKNLKKQVNSLCSEFQTLIYRNSIADDGCYDDLDCIKNILIENKTSLIFVIDCEYVPSGATEGVIEKAITRFNKIKELGLELHLVLVSTSFPNNVSEIGNEYSDNFYLSEIKLFNRIKVEHPEIIYGDYCSINPVRNDQVVMARGWIPRIDVPTSDEIYYNRERRGERSYASTYIQVAREARRNRYFPVHLSDNWGVQQIQLCADGNSPGSNPSFWISVRMSIHLSQQLRRLKS